MLSTTYGYPGESVGSINNGKARPQSVRTFGDFVKDDWIPVVLPTLKYATQKHYQCWLLLTRWMNLVSQKRQQLNELFALNRRVMKAYLLKESLERLWTYRYEGAMLRYLQSWIDQLRWQRLVPFQNLAHMLLDHLDGILNYCRTKVRFGVVEAINANIKTLLRRGRGYKNLGYLLLKAQRMAATKTEFIVLKKVA